MGENRVHDASLAQIPDFHRVVVTTRGNLEAIWKKAHRDHLSHVGRELQDVLTTPQVPDQTDAMEVARAQKTAICLECH